MSEGPAIIVSVDSSALMTTCAGSGGTLVAIIGGFLLTKYLTISSEITATTHQIRDLEDRLYIETEQMHAAQAEYATYQAEYDLLTWKNCRLFLSRATANGPDGPGVTDADLAERFAEYTDHPADVLDEVRTRWNAEAARVVAHEAYNTLEESTSQPEWDMFRRLLPMDKAVPLMWEVRYDVVSERLIKLAQRRHTRSGAEMLAASMFMPPVEPHDPGHGNVGASLERARDGTLSTVNDLQAQLAVAEGRRNRLAQPKGILGGFWWLLLVFVLTVVPSMLLLAAQPATLTLTTRVGLCAGYFVGVLVMFGYFAAVARSLRVPPRDATR